MMAGRLRSILLSMVVGLTITVAGCGPLLTTRQASSVGQPARDCPAPGPDTQLLVNESHGYCLLYSTGFDVVYPNEGETVLVVGSLLDVEHPRVYIMVQDAEGRTAQQAADAVEAQIPADFSIERADIRIDGEDAVVLDRLPGQDINRQVVVVHAGRLYTLTFVPVGEEYGEISTQTQAIYDLVTDSFRFLR